ncbi:class F sortase [Streptomyces sp. 5-8]|uniref:Class F sortase n=1 Tax=Streptomyces musisoli TaxID=2802280 RepID=A0ABS1NY06_9ACTN|nr:MULTISPECIES: class F sortase [Streptomyces]MBL1104820.1 class F sortase [Streptomyces musisoli]MBY8844780.1 class F sortase [Streptomyces sp. SP2-10]
MRRSARVAGRGRSARLGDTAIAAVTVMALGSGVWLVGGTGTHAPPQPTAAEGRPDPVGERRAAPGLAPSVPVRVRIPAIRVNAPLTGLALTRSGSLDAPPAKEKNLAGWYEAGTTPGETGTAIVAGHVDNADGPAVFYDLGALRRGARIEVDREDGTVALFTVYAVEVYSARDFPDEKVYGTALRPELRVITCGGGYSKATGYQGNVVVFARLTGSR